jgi:drug/metabolite transporter (DMT)-like permease
VAPPGGAGRGRGSALTGLPTVVTIAVLASAVAHAAWNAIAHDIQDKLVGFTLLGLGSALCSLPLVALARQPRPASWPFLAASVCFEVLYFFLLMRAYRLGPFSQMYPLARGTSPLVVALLAAVFVGEIPTGAQLGGVLTISAGLACLVFVGHRPTRADLPALIAAVATGLTIATYTTIDGVGVRRSGSTLGYTGWLILLQSLAVPAYALATRGRALAGALRPVAWRALSGGALIVVAYGLVLWAQTRGALAPIAALRETSIIIGAVIGVVLFKERFGVPRILATVLVVAGIVVLSLD